MKLSGVRYLTRQGFDNVWNMREVCARLRNGEVRQRAKCDPKLRHKECESAEVMRLTKLSTKLRYIFSNNVDKSNNISLNFIKTFNENLHIGKIMIE